MAQSYTRLACLVLCLVLAGCAGKPAQPPVYTGRCEIADLRLFPQDLTAYVKKDASSPILSPAEQNAALEEFRSTLFGAWHMKKPSISRRDASLMLNRKARGWKNGSVRWQDREWKAMRSNARMQTYPNINRPGIVVTSTDLREMPTHLPRFTEPTPDPQENPFDYFQYSRLPVGLPVLLCHRTADKRWYYVETSIACGWVDARDVAPVTETFMESWEASPLAAIVQEHTVLGATGRVADIGVILPAAGVNAVMVPVKDKSGLAVAMRANVVPGSVEAMPLPMTEGNVARLGNAMVGQKYGWGGMLDLRDCSAMTRDLMAPFGIWLPRNSQAQARAGERISLRNMSVREREATIVRQGVPFASLVTLKGHVVLYVGTYKGRPVILHDLWGIRVDEPAGEDNRLIVGKVIVSSLTPGKELPNLTNNTTIGDRFHTLTVLGGTPR